jgi:D-alanyl-D-alanine carboxypeptidase
MRATTNERTLAGDIVDSRCGKKSVSKTDISSQEYARRYAIDSEGMVLVRGSGSGHNEASTWSIREQS